jgi:hypothetical protein
MGDDWEPFNERVRRLEADGWTFFTISEAGLPEPLSLSATFERGRYPQVLMQHGTPETA